MPSFWVKSQILFITIIDEYKITDRKKQDILPYSSVTSSTIDFKLVGISSTV